MKPTISPELLQKYDVPTPRYTSYPTALSFEEMETIPVDPTPREGAPLSLYFHMVYCRSLCWYCACNKVVTRKQSKSGAYLDRLLSEMNLRAETLENRPIVQMHLGGGTPTFFTATELEALTRYVRSRFNLSEDAELSIEIDPRELSDEQVSALADSGYTRASLGVQDHDSQVQDAIHRVQPLELTRAAVEKLRSAGIGSINFDLVYGLPYQTPDSFAQTVADVIDLRPDRLAVYSYAHVPWAAPAQKLLTRNTELPQRDDKIAMFLNAAQALADAGYVHIGMDHFALPDDGLSKALHEGTLRRNFMGYTTHRGVDIHAFGASSISQTPKTYFQNERDLGRWEERVDACETPVIRGYVLDEDDEMRRDAIMRVMCSNELDLEKLGAQYGVDAIEYFSGTLTNLEDLVADGLVRVDGSNVRVTDIGRFLVRNVAAAFDSRAERRGFSRAI